MGITLKADNFKLGLLLGFLGPLLGLVVLYFLKCPSCGFVVFIKEFFTNKALITSIGTLSLLANVVSFTIYVNMQKDKTARGIFLFTLLYGMLLLVIKLFI